jgi:hypothetical protein
MNATIGVCLSVLGSHYWEQAPAHRAYLAIPHDHVFGIEVEMEVQDDRREVEFHDLRSVVPAELQSMYSHTHGSYDFEGRSCEMIARELGERLRGVYFRTVQVKVSEDDNCWAKVTVKE